MFGDAARIDDCVRLPPRHEDDSAESGDMPSSDSIRVRAVVARAKSRLVTVTRIFSDADFLTPRPYNHRRLPEAVHVGPLRTHIQRGQP